MIELTSTTRLMVVGMTGSGKTYSTNRDIVRPASNVAVWDPHRKYSVGYYADVSAVPKGAAKWGVCLPWQERKQFLNGFRAFAAEAMNRRVPVIVVDEVYLLVLMGCEAPLAALVTQAQNYGSAVIYLAQRAYSVPVTVRSQSSHIRSFIQKRPEDVAIMNSMAGEEVFSLDKMRSLKQGEFVEAVVRDEG